MQDKMECDWFKPSKHEVIHLRYSTSNLNLNPTKSRNKNNCAFDN